jgi:hypothetical protein
LERESLCNTIPPGEEPEERAEDFGKFCKIHLSLYFPPPRWGRERVGVNKEIYAPLLAPPLQRDCVVIASKGGEAVGF